MSNSVAFVAVCSGRIVGIIFGSSSYNKVIAIDIEVEEDYRNKNIAKRLSQEILKHIVDRNYVLQWDCTESNVASKKLAQALGFIQIKERPYYWFKL